MIYQFLKVANPTDGAGVDSAVTETVNNFLEENTDVDLNAIQKFVQDLPGKALSVGVKVVLALILFFVGMKIIKTVRKIIKKSMEKGSVEAGVVSFVDSFVKVSLFVLLVFMIAASLGVSVTGIAALLGSAGVTIGLALQGSLSNLAGGMLIILLKPFKIGDYIIQNGNGNEGTVVDIHIFYTKLKTIDEKIVIIPNGSLSNSNITNLTMTPDRRVDLLFAVSYNADLDKAKEVAKNVVMQEPYLLVDKAITCVVDSLGCCEVNIGVKFYVLNEHYWDARWRVIENIKKAFDENGIEIPFPQLDVHQK